LVAMKIWEDDVNAKGGLLGRPVKLIYYDDQSSPAQVPAIYSKLLDVDKVDFAVSAYASTQIAAAMPIMIQRKRLFISLFGTGINDEFNYDKYFSMLPTGPTPKPTYTKGYFEVAMAQNPKPTSVAIAAADAEFGRNACDGARENAQKLNLKITYDRRYPPSTTDFGPIVRAIQAGNPDLVVICSYPLDSVGMLKAINEIGFKPKMIGGAMVGLQATAFKMQLGPLLNGIVNYETWLPFEKLQFPGSMELLKKYQARATQEGVDPLGYYMPVWAYAYLQVLGDSIIATNSLDENKIADHLRKTTFKTTAGDVKFGDKGEWAQDRMLLIQFQNIKANTIDVFRDLKAEVLLYPPQYTSGDIIYPFEKARQ
jgi:branched-chain amino acid transport system substrate-binding protein